MVRVATTPSCWLQNHPYSKAWDKALIRLMSENKFQAIDSYTARIGDKELWVGNHPYSSFTPWRSGIVEVRPSRATILMAWDKLTEDTLS